MRLARWIAHRAEWSPEKIALRFEGEEISYAALDLRVRALAAHLAGERGVGRGDRVAHLGFNSPLVIELLFACARLGAIYLPLNWRLAPPELRAVLEHAVPRALVVDADHRATGEAIAAGLPAVPAEALRGGATAPDDGAPDDPVLLVYTSGTSGRPKGVLLTQSALYWNAASSIAAHDLSSVDHVLTVLPTFHVGGLDIHTLPALHAGATVTLHRRFDPAAALRGVATARPTLFLAVPAVSLAMTSHPDWSATDVSSLRIVTTGSSTIPEAVIRPWHERGIPVTQVYGLTESAPVAICLRREDAARKLGSCGKPALHCEARIVGGDGRDVAARAKGEILLRGPSLFREYWKDPGATAAAFTDDGWFRTGDVGHRDAEGFFTIDDRKKDVIITGGENVYPAELENVLADCAGIAEAAVVGRPDSRWVEVPVAFVVARAGSGLDEAAVAALFEGRLARYKHPREIRFVEALPRNVMGKILKHELRARFD
jgi:fatty-acyl-CoA synthase